MTCRPKDPSSAVALMIDRSWKMYEVQVVAPAEFFTLGTVLEGELVWKQPDERHLLFLIFDAVMIKGVSMVDRPFEERIAHVARYIHLSEELSTFSIEDIQCQALEADTIVFVHYSPFIVARPKHFVDRGFSKDIWNGRGGTDHRIDGIILNKCDATYMLGTAYDGSIFKWKEAPTVDLMGPPHALRTVNGCVPTELHNKQISVLASKLKIPQSLDIVEYLIQMEGECVHLFPIRYRPDKTTANSSKTFEATVHNVIENIQVNELVG